jgi:hypothetical protein
MERWSPRGRRFPFPGVGGAVGDQGLADSDPPESMTCQWRERQPAIPSLSKVDLLPHNSLLGTLTIPR